jgi:superfamily II DNA or RNA helicase
MLKELYYPKSCIYQTGKEYEPLHFFVEVLPHAATFNLLLGYFSSSAISVLSIGFAHFIANGGKMRVIINDVLSDKDKQAIQKAKTGEVDVSYAIQDVLKLKNHLDSYGEHFFNCLSYLISQSRIEIISIRPKGSNGISHYKSGIFSDRENKIHFNGSCNFTAKALLENLERLDIRKSWTGEADFAYIEEAEKDFEQLFSKQADFVEYLAIEDIKEVISNQFGSKDLDELLSDELELARAKNFKLNASPTLKSKIEKLEQSIISKQNEPKFPYKEGARAYQQEAYENWVGNNYKGIFAMATGTGKTITSLNCLLEIYKQTNVYQAVILVPTNVLIEQWTKECKKFNYKNIYKVSSNYDWKKELSSLNTEFTWNKNAKPNFIIIATYKTFFGEDFQKGIYKKLPESTLMIADEAHNLASPSNLLLLPTFRFSKRIGLSATPKRIYDAQGTEEIEKFFDDKHPYVINFDMKRAIDERFLCRYNYFPKIVNLTEVEQKQYVEITKKLSRLPQNGDWLENENVQMLLMRRKRILHKAENKLITFREILKELKQEDKLRYALVYAPEGFKNRNEEDEIAFEEENVETEKVIDLYSKALREISPNTTTAQYTSTTKEKDFTLTQFEKGGIDVLFSMKCLDEGVDIPRTETAIFCASTGNPRQFIQRRGRILRRHDDKQIATIYDLVVVPYTEPNSPYFEIEKRLFKNELARVANFADLANNHYEALAYLNPPLDIYGINIYSLESDF